MSIHPFLMHLPRQRANHRQQRHIQEHQLAGHSVGSPFFSGTSRRGTRPETVNLTGMVFDFGFARPQRISSVAMISGCALKAASKLTSSSMRQSIVTDTVTRA